MTEPEGSRRARLVTFYLPQFFPIPENDEWWGPGFTEWTNVAEARPLFRGHRQPRIPGELGFYDLRLAESRAAQADLARAHGIEAFCYWHYWFSGTRLLERPFEEVLRSGDPDFPFCLAWANQPWTDTWLGSGRVLQEQRYSPDDDVAHARWLLRAFADDRYVRFQGRPVFLVYKPTDLPDPRRTTDVWRTECTRAGLPDPYLLGIDAFCFGRDCRELGFDATVSYEPHLGLLPMYLTPGPRAQKLWRNARLGVASARLRVYDYRYLREKSQRLRRRFDHPFHPTLFVGWDNTPRRREDAIVILGDDPALVEAGIGEMADAVADRPLDERLVFVNAWNEWAEGDCLEPDLDGGRAKLEAVRRAVMCPAERSAGD